MTLDCGHEPTPTKAPDGVGHGRNKDGQSLCYECCGVRDRLEMIRTGRAVLYLTDELYQDSRGYFFHVGNWPGTLRFRVREHTRGRHNIAGSRVDVWFTGPDGAPWWGVCYGENTQLTHCRRVKA